MISNRPLGIASIATTVALVMLIAVPAARAQRQKRPSASAGAPETASLEYVCYSADLFNQRVVYVSDAFGLSAAQIAAGMYHNPDGKEHLDFESDAFQSYLVATYNYAPNDEAICGTANTGAAIAAKKKKVVADALAAKKRVVETGWKYTPASSTPAASNTRGRQGGGQVAQQGASSQPASETSGTLFQWHMEKKTDALSGEASTQPAAMKIVAGVNGRPQGLVSVHAYCSSNGVSVFFQADADDNAPKPSFPWYDDTSRGDDGGQITDVRLRVDDRAVHVAQGFPEVDGHQLYVNTVGLLFYEPQTEQRAIRDQENRVTTGVPALDDLLGGVVKQAAQSNAETWQSNSAGPLSDLVSARSIRVELPVTTFDPKPVLDLNPQDPVLHKFVSNCNAKFTR
jgi:hypothetical protein